MTDKRIRTLADWATVGLFSVVIGLPLLGAFFDNRFNHTNDMRSLAAFPQVSRKVRVLKAFPEQFERFWSDHFGFRGALIRSLNTIRLNWLHVPASAHVLIGRASWLFYTPKPPGMDYENARPFTEDELDRWQRTLEKRRERLAQRGCRHLLFIPPDKQTIYPEKLDPLYRPRQDPSRLDQLLARLHSRSPNVEILDIRQPLLVAKENERLYHRTDSHWNDLGAFVGYQQLAGVLAKWFPLVEPMPRRAFEEVERKGAGGDLAQMLSLKEWDHEQWLHLVPHSPRKAKLIRDGIARSFDVGVALEPPFALETDDPRLPRAVVFHDSFFLALAPLLGEHFHRSVYFWLVDFQPDVIERERPDLVIDELLERKLGEVVPNDVGE